MKKRIKMRIQKLLLTAAFAPMLGMAFIPGAAASKTPVKSASHKQNRSSKSQSASEIYEQALNVVKNDSDKVKEIYEQFFVSSEDKGEDFKDYIVSNFELLNNRYPDALPKIIIKIAYQDKNFKERFKFSKQLLYCDGKYHEIAYNNFFLLAKDEKIFPNDPVILAEELLKPENNNHRKKIPQLLLSLAQDTNVDFSIRLDAAAALKNLGEPYKERAAQAYLSMARDTNVESDRRVRSVKILKDFGELYKERAAEVLLSIAQDSSAHINHRLSAVNELRYLGEAYKEGTAQAYLSIAQDASAHIDTRLLAAKALKNLGEPYKERAVQAYLSLAQDASVNFSRRVDAAKALENLGDKATALKAYLSISMDPVLPSTKRVDINARLDAAAALKNLGEPYKERAAKAYLSLAQDASVDFSRRVDATISLQNLGDKATALKAYLSIGMDPVVPSKKRVAIANKLWPEQAYRQDAEKILNDLLSDVAVCQEVSMEILFLGACGRFSPPINHAIMSQALRLNRLSDPNAAVSIHNQLLEKIKSEVIVTFPEETIGTQTVTFTEKAFAPKMIPQSIPVVTQGMVIEGWNELKKEIKNPEAFAEFKAMVASDEVITLEDNRRIRRGIFESVEQAQAALGDLLKGKFYQENLKGDALREEDLKNPMILMLHCMVHYMNGLNSTPQPDGLSKRSKKLIHLLISTYRCASGQRGELETLYNALPKEYKASAGKIGAYDFEIYSQEQEVRKKILKGPLMKSLLKLPVGQEAAEPTHQDNYVEGLLGKRVGLHYAGEKIFFDVHGGFIYRQLRELSLQAALDQFFVHYTPKKMVAGTLSLFKGILEEEEKEAEKYQYRTMMFLKNLNLEEEGGAEMSEEDHPVLCVPAIIGLNERGAVEVLKHLGFLKEVDDKNKALQTIQKEDPMDLSGETRGTKRKREDDDVDEDEQPDSKIPRLR